MGFRVLPLCFVLVLGCDTDVSGAADGGLDAGVDAGDGADAGSLDAGGEDSGADPDAGSSDAGAPVDAAPAADAATCDTCLDSALRWTFVGGRSSQQASSLVTPCAAYQYTLTFLPDGSSRSCSNEVPCSSSGQVAMPRLRAALDDPVVAAAFAGAPMLYGRDPRPMDGQVFEIELGGRTITLGDACAGASGCTAIPAELDTLRTLLRTLEGERLGHVDCRVAFP